MIKKIVLAGAGTFALAAALSSVAAAPAAHRAAPAATAKPQLGAWGVDLAGMDKSANPGDSWYEYVNGTWDKNAVIPPDKSSWGGFGILRDLSDTRTREII